ncbi:Hypothetical predicted protein [Mytilus galloprovincialis]|uniref:Uncharacterized protein n=1 Tax=Mytilus galloprovincialis TaxID=29158 RepID=A0A8B6CPW1_MYTGA|nr:Hypothetical predicted protein [Mytilus galloprovincialis]
MKGCEHDHTKIVKVLVDRGGYWNECDGDGKTPLMKAYAHGHTEIVNTVMPKCRS